MPKRKETTTATKTTNKTKKSAVKGAVEDVTNNNEVETTIEPVQLNLQDLQAATNIIDLATRRGAFQANELATIGKTYDKLMSFFRYATAAQKAAEDDKKETDGESTNKKDNAEADAK